MREETRHRIAMIVLGLWAPTTITLVGLLMVGHTVAMPGPGDPAALSASFATLQGSDRTVVHVIAESCSCTNLLFEHLLERGARKDEVILYVGDRADRERDSVEAGFRFTRTDARGLTETWRLQAAPVLVVLNEDGGADYAGGYFRTPATVNPRDVHIVDALDAGEDVDPLPVFGCAVNAELRRQVDPLGLQDW